MPTRWFKWMLNGLSTDSRFAKAMAEKKNGPASRRESRKGKRR